jgi:hypothetical protein
MTTLIERKARKATTDVQRHEAAIHELMIVLIYNLRKLPRGKRINKAAECALRLEGMGQ